MRAAHALSLLLITATTGVGGCAVSTPHTARQLGHGDVVWAGGLDLSRLLIPRARVQAQVGVGGIGDINAHAGQIPALPVLLATGEYLPAVPWFVGVGFRGYPTRWLTLSAEVDLLTVFGVLETPPPILTATWRATTAVSPTRRLYGGLHLVTGWLLDGDGFGGSNVGLVGGWESKPGETGNTFQIELTLAPLARDQAGGWTRVRDVSDVGTTEQGAPFVGQLSFTYHLMYAADPRARPSKPPSRPPTKVNDWCKSWRRMC